MKYILLSILIIIQSTNLFSQYYLGTSGSGNPEGLNTENAEFPLGGGLPAGWTVIHSGSASSEEWSPTIDLAGLYTYTFEFSFNGIPATSYKVSTSGVLTFTTNASTVPSENNTALPSADIPDNSICIWGLSGTQSTNTILHNKFGSRPNRQHWIMFASYGIPGQVGNIYCSIVLDETTNMIYLVDQRNNCPVSSLTMGIQVDNSTAVEISGSPNYQSVAGDDPANSDNYYYEFIQGVNYVYDIEVTNVDHASYNGLNNAPIVVQGSLTNHGTDVVTSFDINYSANGQAPVTSAISGVNIPQDGSYNFVHPIAWTPTIGNIDLDVFASSINGNMDQNPDNDVFTRNIEILDVFEQFYPVMETFTSSTCGSCAFVEGSLGSTYAANLDKTTLIKYPMYYPSGGDPYFTTECGERSNYYGIGSLPTTLGQGMYFMNGSWTPAQLQASIDGLYDNYSKIILTANHEISGTTVTSAVSIEPLFDIPVSDLILHVAIIENTTFNNATINGMTEFHQVFKKMMPNTSGTTIGALTAGNPQIVNLSYTFTAGHTVEEFSDLSLVAFIQNNTTKEVYQSIWSTDGITVNTAENQLSKEGIIGLYPNPAISDSHIKYKTQGHGEHSIQLKNVMGEEVYMMNLPDQNAGQFVQTMNFSHLPSGLYLLSMMINNKEYSRRLVISH